MTVFGKEERRGLLHRTVSNGIIEFIHPIPCGAGPLAYFRCNANHQLRTWLFTHDRGLRSLLYHRIFPRGTISFRIGLLTASLIVGLIGIIVEILLLRELYQTLGLFLLMTTFCVVLIVQDLAGCLFGSEELLGAHRARIKRERQYILHLDADL